MKGSDRDPRSSILAGPMATVSEDTRDQARVVVASNALNVDDCRELLDMLGIAGEELLYDTLNGKPPWPVG